MGKRLRFEFDTANLDHISIHNVSRRDVFQAFAGKYIVVKLKEYEQEPRWRLFGKTAAGRYLTVIFTKRKGKIRPVTAYTMNQKDRDLYAQKLK